MNKIKKIFLAIGAGLTAVLEAFVFLFFFEKKKNKYEKIQEDLEAINKSQEAAIKAAQTFQEEQKKSEEIKNQIYTEFGSDASVNATLELMHNNEKRSKDRKSTRV